MRSASARRPRPPAMPPAGDQHQQIRGHSAPQRRETDSTRPARRHRRPKLSAARPAATAARPRRWRTHPGSRRHPAASQERSRAAAPGGRRALTTHRSKMIRPPPTPPPAPPTVALAFPLFSPPRANRHHRTPPPRAAVAGSSPGAAATPPVAAMSSLQAWFGNRARSGAGRNPVVRGQAWQAHPRQPPAETVRDGSRRVPLPRPGLPAELVDDVERRLAGHPAESGVPGVGGEPPYRLLTGLGAEGVTAVLDSAFGTHKKAENE